MKKGKICTNPWTTLRLQPIGRHAPCCVASFMEPQKYPTMKEDIMELFNSEAMINLRRMIVNGRCAETPCAHCVGNQNFGKPDFSHLNQSSQNVKRAAEAYFNKKIVLDYAPLIISASLSTRCNLKCVMCSQARNSKDLIQKTDCNYPAQGLLDFFDSSSFAGTEIFAISGGECFFTRDGLQIIKYIVEKRPQQMQFKVTTNGTLLNNYIDELVNIPNFNLEISVDGYGESYEHIRKGAKWKSVRDNILEFDRKRKKENSHIHLVTLLMRSSICDLPRLVEELMQHVDLIDTIHIEGEFLFENVFLFPSLLEDLPWNAALQRTILFLESQDIQHLKNRIIDTERLLKKSSLRPSKKIIAREIERLRKLVVMDGEPWMYIGKGLERFLTPNARKSALSQTIHWFDRINLKLPDQVSDQVITLLQYLEKDETPHTLFFNSLSEAARSLSNKRILIWGCGGKYQTELQPFLREIESQNVILGFVVSDLSTIGADVDSYRVHDVLGAQRLDADAVIIASCAYREILDAIPRLCRERCLVALPTGMIVETYKFLYKFSEQLTKFQNQIANTWHKVF